MNNEQYHYEREINRQGKPDEISAKEITLNYLKELKKKNIEQLRNAEGNIYNELVVSIDINAINGVIKIIEERATE